MALLPPPPFGNITDTKGSRTNFYYQWFNLVQSYLNTATSNISTNTTNISTNTTNISNLTTQLGTITQVVVNLNTTAVQAAYATPQILIAAPGSSKVIYITDAWVYTNSTGHTAFATGTAPIIQYGTTVHGGGTLATSTGLVAGDITAGTSQIRNLGPMATAASTALSNKAITFSNATGAYTAGTGSVITFILNYVTLTASI